MSRMTEQIGRVLGGRYRLVQPVGRGASAQVYRAEDVRLRRAVAVKVLHEALAEDEGFLRRFRAEAQAAAALNHPHVMAVYDWGQDDDGLPWIVTEYLGGGSLRGLLDRGHRLTPSQALLVGLHAARGLDYAHRRGFVHRDIKPANLLFDDDGRLRIADFGLARALAEAAWTEPQGAVVGTARYASPEQAQGLALTGRADVYSLALVVVEVVTGEVPFAADTTLGTLMARVGKPLVTPPALGPLAPVLDEAGRPEPEDRLDARSLAAALAQVIGQLPRPAPLPLAGPSEGHPVDDPHPTELGGRAAPPDGGGDDDLDDDDLDVPAFVAAPPARPAAAPRGDPLLDDPGSPDDEATLLGGEGVTVVSGGGDDRTVVEDRTVVDDPAEPRPFDLEVDDDEAGAEWDPRSPTGHRRRWPLRVFLVLLLAGVGVVVGLLVTNLAEATPTHPVPPVAGLTEVAARSTLTERGWEVGREVVRRDGTDDGQVLGTRPREGVELSEGSPIVLVVSEGPLLRTVPEIPRGMPREEAERLLREVRLVPAVDDTRYDEEVPPGHVIGLGGGTPATLETGSEVRVVVSRGPEPRVLPEGWPGRPEAEVVAAVEGLGLVPDVSRAFSDDVDAGLVIGTDPGAGATLARGDPVAVVVSRGPDLVTVPDVRGTDDLREAVALLEAAGLVAGDAQGPAAGRPAGTSPAAGQQVRRGSVVDVTLRRGGG